jgi:hypothetical protein
MKTKSSTDTFGTLIIVTVVLLLISTSPSLVRGQTQQQMPLPSGIVAYVPIKLVNNQTVALENGTQVLINVDWYHYRNYLASNLMNVEFLSSSWIPLYAWMENNASRTSNDSKVWVNIREGGINAESIVTIYLAFLNSSIDNFSPDGYWGEAPELSHQYGEYDNGAMVFNYYLNFSGYVLPSGWTSLYMDYIVYNEIIAQSVGNGITGSLVYSGTFNPETEVMDVNAYFDGLSGGSGSQLIGWKSSGSTDVILGLSDAGNGTQYSLLSSSSSAFKTFNSLRSIQNGSLSHFQVWSVGAVGSSNAFLDLNYGTQVSISPYYAGTDSHPYISSSTTNHFIFLQWLRIRVDPPDNAMPSSSFGHIQRPYYVTFAESGLPVGTEWSVTMNGVTQSSTTDVILFPVSNGSYEYEIQNVSGFEVSPENSTLYVNGLNSSISLLFSKLFSVSISESGLSAGTSWNITFDGENYTSYNTTKTFQVTNGTYPYSIPSVNGFNCTTPTGTLKVDGTGVERILKFVFMTQFTFIELGLPTGSRWSVDLGGKLYNSSSAFIEVTVPNGTYSYIVLLPSGFEANNVIGGVNWNNSVVLINATSPLRNALEISVFVIVLALISFYFVRRYRKERTRTGKNES